jgi:hypothetical protein
LKRHEILPRAHPYLMVGMICLTIVADYVTGPSVQFPILYLLPIGFAAWSSRLGWGCGLAVTMALMRLVFVMIGPEAWSGPELLLNALIRMAVFLCFVYLVNRTAQHYRDMQREVRALRGLLSICSFCKKIRNDADEWIELERYLSAHSEAQFSHGLCPGCLRQHYPAYDRSLRSP